MPSAKKLVQLVVDRYCRLRARGKPQAHEWTILAGIVMTDVASEVWRQPLMLFFSSSSQQCIHLGHCKAVLLSQEVYLCMPQAAEVVAIATGTKVLNQNQLCANGTVVNDCHAEVLARYVVNLNDSMGDMYIYRERKRMYCSSRESPWLFSGSSSS